MPETNKNIANHPHQLSLRVSGSHDAAADGGFAAALKEAGIPFFEAVRRILPDALPPKEPSR